MGFWGMNRRCPSSYKTSSVVLKRGEMAGFAGYVSASFTTQKSQRVCFLYFYLDEWLFRGLEVNRRKFIGFMVSDTILFLLGAQAMAMPTTQMRLDEMKAKHIFSYTDRLIEALITPLS